METCLCPGRQGPEDCQQAHTSAGQDSGHIENCSKSKHNCSQLQKITHPDKYSIKAEKMHGLKENREKNRRRTGGRGEKNWHGSGGRKRRKETEKKKEKRKNGRKCERERKHEEKRKKGRYQSIRKINIHH